MQVPLGDTYYLKFTTRAFSTGAPTTLSSTPAISVYEEGNLTQITAGITLTVDYDSVTGLNDVAIVATSGNGYEVGKYYSVVITTGTVDSVSVVGEVVGHFRVMAAEASAGVPDANVASLDTNVITSSAIATNALTNSAFATSYYNATADAVWDEAQSGHVSAGTFGEIATEIASILDDTGTNGVLLASTATSAQLVDDVWDEVLSGGTHNVASSAGRRLRSLQDNGLYALASVWVDEVAGTSTGTTNYEDATVTNRANDLDNAQTIADAIDLQSIQITNGNSITLTAGLEGYNVWGNASTLALGSQNIGGSVFRQFGSVSGVGTTTANPAFFEDCIFGNVTLPPCTLQRISLDGTLTIGSAGDFQLRDCSSAVAGSGAPTLAMAAVGATTVSLRRWSGGLNITGMAAGDVVSVDVISGGTIDINGTGGTVVVRGMCNVVDSSGGSVSITETSVVNMTKINSEVDTALTDYDAATGTELAAVDTKIDTIDTNVDTAVLGIITGTAQTGTLSTTQASTDLTGYADDQLIGRVIIWTSGNCEGEATDITDYANTNGVLTFTALTTAPANGDTFKIV